MNKRQFKQKVLDVLNAEVDNVTWEQQTGLIRQYIVEAERERELDQSSKGKKWADAELRTVLRTAPTAENIMMLARAFRRGYGSIEQIFRWAAASDKTIIERDRTDNVFLQQIKRIAKEVGWRAN